MKKSILELTDNEVIHAPTLEIAEKLCKKFHELGLTRHSGGSYLKWDLFNSYKQNTCFNTNEGKYADVDYYSGHGYTLLSISDLSDFDDEPKQLQPHYDNTHGSLYKIAEQRGWNSYQFDIIKRIDRCLKKGQFKEDLQKTKDLIDLYLQESE